MKAPPQSGAIIRYFLNFAFPTLQIYASVFYIIQNSIFSGNSQMMWQLTE